MGRFIDLTGNTYGRLTVLHRYVPAPGETSKHTRWVSECSCGGRAVSCSHDLRTGKTKSCGCIRIEHCLTMGETTHGMTDTPEFRTWSSMRKRCYWTGHPDFHLWGGRGIRVCDAWRESFEAFYADMGPRPGKGYSIDRIDNDGNYEPGNCRWATASQQNSNRRNFRWSDEARNRVRRANAERKAAALRAESLVQQHAKQ